MGDGPDDYWTRHSTLLHSVSSPPERFGSLVIWLAVFEGHCIVVSLEQGIDIQRSMHTKRSEDTEGRTRETCPVGEYLFRVFTFVAIGGPTSVPNPPTCAGLNH